MIEIAEITSQAEMNILREEWNSLLTKCPKVAIFQTWEWINSCMKNFGRMKRFVVLCIRDEGNLVAIAPMEITLMYGLPFRRLQFIGVGVSDYMDFVIAMGFEDQALNAIFGWINANTSRWDLLDLQQIPEGSTTLEFCSRDTNHQGVLIPGEKCPFLPLAENWDAMLGVFGKKMRFNLGYYERLMRRDFENVEICLLGEDEIAEGMAAFFDLHTKRWRKRWLPGMLADTGRQRFHKEIAKECIKNGSLKLHALRVNGKIRSILYCYIFGGRYFYYLGGFDPELSKYSLGTVLTGHAVRSAVENGCAEFDFLRGDEHYKSRWTKEFRLNTRLVKSKQNTRSKMAYSICNLEQRIENYVKHELHKRIGAGN
ncbi:GNAT family N-acetyltransferase [uncultured Desulfobulbus sp.]|uniref:GNAT family N-acetyltransferase n=1 Tax=uncultured Desulfobulbus sp. TaxID=239745 RepID=UPI0029C6162C|nr:GNAT family N-acetyltransferase [uncultured Desulfobulbus sp.]